MVEVVDLSALTLHRQAVHVTLRRLPVRLTRQFDQNAQMELLRPAVASRGPELVTNLRNRLCGGVPWPSAPRIRRRVFAMCGYQSSNPQTRAATHLRCTISNILQALQQEKLLTCTTLIDLAKTKFDPVWFTSKTDLAEGCSCARIRTRLNRSSSHDLVAQQRQQAEPSKDDHCQDVITTFSAKRR